MALPNALSSTRTILKGMESEWFVFRWNEKWAVDLWYRLLLLDGDYGARNSFFFMPFSFCSMRLAKSVFEFASLRFII